MQQELTPFAFKGTAALTHLNLRKEGDEDSRELAVDAKFKAKTARSIFKHFDTELADVLWTDAQAVRNLFLGALKFSLTAKCDFDIYGMRFTGVEVKSFSLTPLDGERVEIIFSVSFNPSTSDMKDLSACVSDDVDIDLQPVPDLFTGAGEAGKFTNLTITSRAALGPTIPEEVTDPLLSEAVEIVKADKRASISGIQRKLRIGYNRAARMLESMETMGLVSPMSPEGHRTVLLGLGTAPDRAKAGSLA